ncbi:hypothetical protein HaLaN_30018 [Haematococcus lacustris]|uniref:Uncharacterized protein n=1 Tax=Haematococcus lacustris TaxID=44745 RepID=A0A6A0AEE6_HAELA|nr:hypothetical protein HaLaN_30018 [Haematococcus lacustris]
MGLVAPLNVLGHTACMHTLTSPVLPTAPAATSRRAPTAATADVKAAAPGSTLETPPAAPDFHDLSASAAPAAASPVEEPTLASFNAALATQATSTPPTAPTTATTPLAEPAPPSPASSQPSQSGVMTSSHRFVRLTDPAAAVALRLAELTHPAQRLLTSPPLDQVLLTGQAAVAKAARVARRATQRATKSGQELGASEAEGSQSSGPTPAAMQVGLAAGREDTALAPALASSILPPSPPKTPAWIFNLAAGLLQLLRAPLEALMEALSLVAKLDGLLLVCCLCWGYHLHRITKSMGEALSLAIGRALADRFIPKVAQPPVVAAAAQEG